MTTAPKIPDSVVEAACRAYCVNPSWDERAKYGESMAFGQASIRPAMLRALEAAAPMLAAQPVQDKDDAPAIVVFIGGKYYLVGIADAPPPNGVPDWRKMTEDDAKAVARLLSQPPKEDE